MLSGARKRGGTAVFQTSTMFRAQEIYTPEAVVDWLQLIRAEYLEIPGLHLTQPQAERLWGLDSLTCEALLGALIQTGFLRRTQTGAYVRAGSGG